MPPLSRAKRTLSFLVLGLIVVASATQTELANYVTAQKGYSKPYFTFFLTHSFFSIIFPVHLLLLRFIKPDLSTKEALKRLRIVVAEQLDVNSEDGRALYRKLARVICKLTALISLPSICWYIAVPLTGVTDLTTIYATATWWTYLFSLILLRTPLSRVVVLSIVIAFIGTILITYSGVEESKHREESGEGPDKVFKEPPHRIVGDLVMLTGAIILGFYEVIYKLALPEGHGGVNVEEDEEETTAEVGYQAVSTGEEQEAIGHPGHRRSYSNSSRPANSSIIPLDSGTQLFRSDPLATTKTKLPLALHANLLTSLIGITTMALFWIPIPLIHWLGWEPFELPWGSWGLMMLICATGAIYNGGFMILIGLLGPTTASVANLLTIGLVALIDSFYLGRAIPGWTLVGASLVGSGFGVLLWAGEDG